MCCETELTVRYAETDKMGIAHHSNYSVWFEAGRTDYFRKLGYSYNALEVIGVLLPLIALKCHFKKPARYEDSIVVETRISRMTCVRIVFSYDVFALPNRELLASGETAHAWTDKDFIPINLGKRQPGLMDALNKCLKGN